MKCVYCAWEQSHDSNCPESQALKIQGNARLEYNKGYRLGRAGENCPPSMSGIYRLGYQRGVVALEEAENGHDGREA